jgi:DNA-binding MarR family transcriptional regulator
LITAAGQRLSAELDASLRSAGFADLRASHAPIFMAIEPDGSRMTDVANRAKMTKQAAGELTRYLTQHGYLTVRQDPHDRRVRLVSLTPQGWEAIAVGEQVIAAFDQWLERVIGAEEVAGLRRTLTRIANTEPAER